MIRLSYLEWRASCDDFGELGAGRFRRRAPGKKGGLLLAGMVARTSICLRRLAGGRRSGIVGFLRVLANLRVTVEALLDGWGAEHTPRCVGRHILAIQDCSEINFTPTKERSRGLGEIGKGSGRGVRLHAMLGVDAETGGILGLATGRVWTRAGRVTVPHRNRPLSEKESNRWLSTAEAAKTVLRQSHMVTEIRGRESDIYEKWARLPESVLNMPGFHILTRAMADRSIREGGGKLSSAPLQLAGTARVALRARALAVRPAPPGSWPALAAF
jgi:hypothetical protein